MRIAVTGAAGHVGRLVVGHALGEGHAVRGIDRVDADAAVDVHSSYTFVRADLQDYARVLEALAGCEGVVHLAAARTPGDGRAAAHNNNVVASWNVLRAAAELGIERVAQASSINVIGLYWNEGPLQIDYLPLDEAHPCRPDDPYSLSKLICEAQADTIVRRFPVRIASLRIHMVVPTRARALGSSATAGARRQLWGYTLDRSCARAFVRALTATHAAFAAGQHEAFFIVEPCVAHAEDAAALVAREWPGVPVRGALERGLFDCSKAARLLGWRGE